MTENETMTLQSMSLNIDFESEAFRFDLSRGKICVSNYGHIESVLSKVDQLLADLNAELEVSYEGQ